MISVCGLFKHPVGVYAPDETCFLQGSYVKFVEMAGGRVVPIEYDLPFDEMKARCVAALPAGCCIPAAHSEELVMGGSAIHLAQLHTSNSSGGLLFFFGCVTLCSDLALLHTVGSNKQLVWHCCLSLALR